MFPEPLCFRETERQIVGQDLMQGLGLGLRNRLMRLGQLVDVGNAGGQRIMIELAHPSAEHVQDSLRMLGIVFVPAIVDGLARAHRSH